MNPRMTLYKEESFRPSSLAVRETDDQRRRQDEQVELLKQAVAQQHGKRPKFTVTPTPLKD
jgi:hypothetical protein